MTNNDILRRLRYALNINNQQIIRLFDLSGRQLTQGDLDVLLKKDNETGWVDCPDLLLESFLDGLILDRRGRQETSAESGPELNNNVILRKLRIALQLKDKDMLQIFGAGGLDVSKSELSALFRNPGHRNYTSCRDQMLRAFLKGLSTISREEIQ